MRLRKILYYPIFLIRRFKNKLYRSCYIKPSLAKCGKNVYIGDNFVGTLQGIEIGSNVSIGPNCVFYSSLAKIVIGNYVMVSPNVTIITGSHKTNSIGKYMIENTEVDKINEGVEKYDLPVIIEDDVWIGSNVLILKGVTIGKGSIIHAGQIVTKSVPPYTIYINQNIQIKRFSEEEIKKHEELIRSRDIRDRS